MGDLANAIEIYKNAQLESYENATQWLMKTIDLEKRQKDAAAYQSEEKAEEAKQLGNTHFRGKEWGPAVAAYDDAVEHAPKNSTIQNNISAASCKVMDVNGTKREIEVALDIDPKYVKAWAQKGDNEVLMKESHNVMENYKKGLMLDSSNKTCWEGLQKVTAQVTQGSTNMTEEEWKERASHAMADPEIQIILMDPMINQVLKGFNENPNAA